MGMSSDLRLEGVPCFEHLTIQDETLPEVPENFPFSKKFLDELVANCPVVVEFPDDDEDSHTRPDLFNRVGRLEGSPIGLRRISTDHGRSYELFVGSSEQVPQLIWKDDHDTEFTSLSIKGNNFTDPHVFASLTAPSGYIPYGLFETDAFKRVVRASRIMRENDVDTEMIVKVLEPKYLRYNKLDPETGTSIEGEYEYVTQPEFKRRLLQDHWKKIADQPGAADEFKKVRNAIEGMSYFFALRAMAVGTRIKDLVVRDKQTFLGEMEKVFAYFNARVAHVKKDGTPRELYSVHNDKHIRNYLYMTLPTLIGGNLGRMHRIGLAHTFPYLGNINAHGALVDLDSVRGEPLGLGDKPVTEEDFQRDIDQVVGHDYGTADDHALFFSWTEDHCGRVTEDDEDEDVGNLYLFRIAFLSQYVAERYAIPDDRNINSVAENDLLPALSRIDELLIKAVDVNSFFIDDLLKSAFGTAVLPELLTEEERAAAEEEYTEWIQDNLLDYLQGKAINFLADKRITDMHWASGPWFYETVATEFVSTLGKDFRKKRYIDPVMENKNTTTLLRAWIAANKKTDCTWSNEGLLELLKFQMAQQAYMDVGEPAITRGVGSAGRYSLRVNSVIDPMAFGVIADTEPLKAVADGHLFLVWTGIDLDIFLANMDDEVADKPIGVVYEGGSIAEGITLDVPKGYTLGEIATDGPVRQIALDDKERQCVGEARVTVRNTGQSSYFAYSLENNVTGEMTLYIVQ